MFYLIFQSKIRKSYQHFLIFSCQLFFSPKLKNMPMNVIDEKLNPILDDPRADSVVLSNLYIEMALKLNMKI